MYSSIAELDQRNRLRHMGYKQRTKVQHNEKTISFFDFDKGDTSNSSLFRFEKNIDNILDFKGDLRKIEEETSDVVTELVTWTNRAEVQNSTFLYYNWSYEINNVTSGSLNDNGTWWDVGPTVDNVSFDGDSEVQNWWALLALFLVLATAAGNILVCLAICWERRLQNVTNYFLMSLAVTDLMVAVLVMPIGILTLFRGKYFYSF